MKILIPMAEGFEEIEIVTVADILRRAGLDVVTAGLCRRAYRRKP
ncbi:MAG: DJ-1/PfpI family protein [Methanotrichaceae archaeon]